LFALLRRSQNRAVHNLPHGGEKGQRGVHRASKKNADTVMLGCRRKFL
jgi:hypothetical protein